MRVVREELDFSYEGLQNSYRAIFDFELWVKAGTYPPGGVNPVRKPTNIEDFAFSRR